MKTKVILLIIMSVAQQVVAMQEPKISVLFAGGERHDYSRSTLRQFKTVATLLDDKDWDDDPSVSLEEVKKQEADSLLRIVYVSERIKKQEKIAHAAKNLQEMIQLFNAARRLKPNDDDKTIRLIALAWLRHTHTLADSCPEGSLRAALLQDFYDDQRDTMKALMSRFVEVVADTTDYYAPEEVRDGVRKVMQSKPMIALLSNDHAYALVQAIKKRVVQYEGIFESMQYKIPFISVQPVFIENIRSYVFGDGASKKLYPAVPHIKSITVVNDGQGKVKKVPGEGYFPLSIQELLDVQLFPQFVEYAPPLSLCLHCPYKGLTSLEGIQNVPRIRVLSWLDLKGNAIQELPVGIFKALVQLQFLYLECNQLEDLPEGLFADLTQLQTLSLRNNKIQMLPVGIFKKLVHLQVLYLECNQLKDLPEGLFADLTQLQKLDLSGNQITQTEAQIRADNPQLPGTCKIFL